MPCVGPAPKTSPAARRAACQSLGSAFQLCARTASRLGGGVGKHVTSEGGGREAASLHHSTALIPPAPRPPCPVQAPC